MNEKNIEIIDELRKFVLRVLKSGKSAAAYELECAMEAAKIIMKYNHDDCGSFSELNSGIPLCPKMAAYDKMLDECIAIGDDQTMTDDEKREMESWLRKNHIAQWEYGYSLPPLTHS